MSELKAIPFRDDDEFKDFLRKAFSEGFPEGQFIVGKNEVREDGTRRFAPVLIDPGPSNSHIDSLFGLMNRIPSALLAFPPKPVRQFSEVFPGPLKTRYLDELTAVMREVASREIMNAAKGHADFYTCKSIHYTWQGSIDDEIRKAVRYALRKRQGSARRP